MADPAPFDSEEYEEGTEDYEPEEEDFLDEMDEDESLGAEEGVMENVEGRGGGTDPREPVLSAGQGTGRRALPLGRFLSRISPRRLLRVLGKQRSRVERFWWRLGDTTQDGLKGALQLALRAARPVVVYLIVTRVLKTVGAARDPIYHMARLPEHEQINYYYSQLLGDDWKEQIQEDLVEALKDVNDGYITDEINHEKRKLAAVILRRLEVEEWDKERMRHFYYGLYGLGPWYWDMEERLHNPFFIGARAWNGPIENWVGENRTYLGDTAADKREMALRAAEMITGRRLQPQAAAELKEREELRAIDDVIDSPYLKGLVDPVGTRERLALS